MFLFKNPPLFMFLFYILPLKCAKRVIQTEDHRSISASFPVDFKVYTLLWLWLLPCRAFLQKMRCPADK